MESIRHVERNRKNLFDLAENLLFSCPAGSDKSFYGVSTKLFLIGGNREEVTNVRVVVRQSLAGGYGLKLSNLWEIRPSVRDCAVEDETDRESRSTGRDVFLFGVVPPADYFYL